MIHEKSSKISKQSSLINPTWDIHIINKYYLEESHLQSTNVPIALPDEDIQNYKTENDEDGILP